MALCALHRSTPDDLEKSSMAGPSLAPESRAPRRVRFQDHVLPPGAGVGGEARTIHHEEVLSKPSTPAPRLQLRDKSRPELCVWGASLASELP